jgi:Uma2 family endonuclease
VVVAVEILSPGSVRTDTVVEPMEYADAGIPHFWLIDPAPPVTATVYRLIEGEYEESLRAEKVLQVEEPCPLRIELDELLPASLR